MDKDMQDVLKKAEVLVEALPYIQKFNRKIIVVKYGGSAMSNEELQKEITSLKEELYTLRFAQATGSLENPARIRDIKKTIARIKTVITERANAQAE